MPNNGDSIEVRALKRKIPISGHEEFFQHGEAYLKTAAAAHEKRKKAFSAELISNLAMLAIEKFVMAALMQHGTLPCNHAMSDLAESMEQTFPRDQLSEILEGMRALDSCEALCGFETVSKGFKSEKEIRAILALADRMRKVAKEKLLGLTHLDGNFQCI